MNPILPILGSDRHLWDMWTYCLGIIYKIYKYWVILSKSKERINITLKYTR